MIVIQGGRFWR